MSTRLALPTARVQKALPLFAALACFLALNTLSCQAPAAEPTAPALGPKPVPKSGAVELLPSQIPPPTATPTHTRTPAPSQTATPSNTATPSSTNTSTLAPATPTRAAHAPALPPTGVHFVTNGSRAVPALSLTFDLCQAPTSPSGFDQGIYDALVEAQAPATFFVGGDWARTHPEQLQLLAQNPLFELGNHSWSHPDFVGLDEATLRSEILKTQDILYRMTGATPRLFRLPAGLYDDLALSVIAYHGLYTIQWDVVTADPVFDNQADNINQIVRDNVQNGSIIVMHANGRGWHTAEALPEIIAYLRDQGYTLVTVSELLGIVP